MHIFKSQTPQPGHRIFGQKTRALTPSIHLDQMNGVRFQTRHQPAANHLPTLSHSVSLRHRSAPHALTPDTLGTDISRLQTNYHRMKIVSFHIIRV